MIHINFIKYSIKINNANSLKVLLFGNLSKPAKIGIILMLAGIGIVGMGTGMGDESISYYGLLIIVTGLFIYLAYNYNFTGKFGKTKYPYDEKKKKRRRK